MMKLALCLECPNEECYLSAGVRPAGSTVATDIPLVVIVLRR